MSSKLLMTKHPPIRHPFSIFQKPFFSIFHCALAAEKEDRDDRDFAHKRRSTDDHIRLSGYLVIKFPGRTIKFGDGTGELITAIIRDKAAMLLICQPTLAFGELLTGDRIAVARCSLSDFVHLVSPINQHQQQPLCSFKLAIRDYVRHPIASMMAAVTLGTSRRRSGFENDVVRQISHCHGASCMAPASAAMTRDVVSCRPSDWLAEAWTAMKQGQIKNLPIIDRGSKPLGVLTAQEVFQQLLSEVENEEALLRDYVMSVGYW